YFDRVALTFGEQKSNAVHALRSEHDPQEVFIFSNYGYLRETTSAPAQTTLSRLVARGSWIGFRVRCSQCSGGDALIVNGTNAPSRKEGDYVVFGDVSKTLEPSQPILASVSELTKPEQSLEIVAPKEPVRLATRGSRQVT